MYRLLAGAALSALLLGGTAQAATYTLTLTADANTLTTNTFTVGGVTYTQGYVVLEGLGAPFSVQDGDILDVEVDVTSGSFDVPVNDDMFVGLDFLGQADASPPGGELVHASVINGTINFSGGGGGCCFSVIYGAPGNAPLNVASFDTNATVGGLVAPFEIATVRLSFQSSNAFVPEPATWALMIVGFGGAGALPRRRRMAPA